jgi:hypothetical protein
MKLAVRRDSFWIIERDQFSLGVPVLQHGGIRERLALRAGGVADHFVTLMLRQGDASVFKRYSQAKLNMMREALDRLDRRANEHERSFGAARPN